MKNLSQTMDLATVISRIVMPEMLYHGMSLKINSSELLFFKEKMVNESFWNFGKDFGPGFYTTHLIEQAKRWANRSPFKRARYEGVSAINYSACVLKIAFNRELMGNAEVLTFTDASKDWARFILFNRMQTKHSTPVTTFRPEIIIGYMADNDTNELVSKYMFMESYSFEDFYRDIQMRNPLEVMTMDELGNQYTLCNENLNKALSLEGCYLMEKGVWNYYGIDDSHLSQFQLL